MTRPIALIVGVGDGLSASLARNFAADHALVLAARNTDKIAALASETSAETRALDASDPKSVDALFGSLPAGPRVVIYNPSLRSRGPVADLDPEMVRKSIEVTAFGAFLVGQQAARAMLAAELVDDRRGTILFTGASAGVKGFPHSVPFAMGKFAQRGLAQSMARELHPKGIHVAWVNIDGGIRPAGRDDDGSDAMLDPDAIAQEYRQVTLQHRSTWSDELTLRPWVENF